MARGAPKRPAPVSGPGAQSRRTDGGPGSKSQPIRTATGGAYGEAKASEEQQKAAPLAAQPAPTPSATSGVEGGEGAPAVMPSAEGVFGPSVQPNTPLNAGITPPSQESPLDGATMVQLLFEKFPSQYLARLLQNDRPRTL